MGNIDPAIFNRISTSAELNLFFFLVFILFALSLFGWFEIRMPGNLSARTDARSNLQTWLGIFFMAMTPAIVSFYCTGPILVTGKRKKVSKKLLKRLLNIHPG